MVQAAVLDGQFLDRFSPFYEGCIPPKVDVGWRDVVEALVVTVVVVMIDEGADLAFEIAGQIIVFQQNPVFERLVPALNLVLGLRVVWCAPDVVHALIFKPHGQIAGDVGRAIVAEQPRFVNDIGTIAS